MVSTTSIIYGTEEILYNIPSAWIQLMKENLSHHPAVILEKYVDLENSCLTDTEKKQVLAMLYKYKEAFCLRDEIGTVSKPIEIEIDR